MRTRDELSIVCDQRSVAPAVQAERGWACLQVRGPLDHALVGVLSSILQPLAAAGVSVFALSSYETDAVLVRSSALAKAVDALRSAGHTVSI
jgi:uncharacterized protein